MLIRGSDAVNVRTGVHFRFWGVTEEPQPDGSVIDYAVGHRMMTDSDGEDYLFAVTYPLSEVQEGRG